MSEQPQDGPFDEPEPGQDDSDDGPGYDKDAHDPDDEASEDHP